MYKHVEINYQPQHPLLQFDSSGPRAVWRERGNRRGPARRHDRPLADRMWNNEPWYELNQRILRREDRTVNVVGHEGMIPLQVACYLNCSTELFLTILERTDNKNYQNRDGNTALMLAVTNGYDAFVDRLSEKAHVDPTIQNNQRKTALWIAVNGSNGFGDHRMVKTLLLRFRKRGITSCIDLKGGPCSLSPWELADKRNDHRMMNLLEFAFNGEWQKVRNIRVN
tara:strand:- start:534 stop:1208 length:675 start_codon:yes stop_codon:yes gene_type:complete